METTARQLCQCQITRHRDLLGFARNAFQAEDRRQRALMHDATVDQIFVLRVTGDGSLDQQRVLERVPHQACRPHRPIVVGEGDCADIGHVSHLGQLAALALLGRRPHR